MVLPQEAMEMNLSGRVIVRMLIDENGCYVRHLPPKPGNSAMTKAIELYLPQIMFTPATKEGVPIKFWVIVPFSFRPQ